MRHLENGKMVLLPNAFINKQQHRKFVAHTKMVRSQSVDQMCVCICVLCTPYRFGTHQFDAVQVAPSNACAERFSDLKRFVLYWFWFLLVTA